MDQNAVLSEPSDYGFSAAALVETASIPFRHEFRKYCEDNFCGQYGANYSCPPSCGSCQEMQNSVQAFKQALVLQTQWEIPDFRDWSSIFHAKNEHNRLLSEYAKKNYPMMKHLIVGASSCGLCERCAILDALPCRFPDQKVSCMSAYCIYVKGLCDQTGMQYDCGPGKIAFFGMIVFG